MKKMISYLLKYWKIAIFAPLFMMLEVVIDLYQPMLMQKIIDVGVGNGDLDYIKTYSLYMLALSVVGMSGAVASGFIAVKASQTAGGDIRSDLFRKVQTLSFKNIDTLKPNALITRLTNDVVQIQQFFQQMMRIMVRAPLMLVGSVVLTFYISGKFGMILLSFIILLLCLVLLVVKRAKPLFKKVQNSVDTVNGVLLENIKGIRVIKAFVGKKIENKRFEVANERLAKDQIKANQLFALLMPMIMFTINMVIVLVLWFGGQEVVKNHMMVGEIIAVINYITRLMFALLMTGMIFFRVSKSAASADRINEVFDMTSEIEYGDESRSIKGDIELKNVSFKYTEESKDYVLQNINIKIGAGQTVAVIGSTGAGKSTLMQLIPRYYDVSEGEILIDGIPLKNISKKCINHNIAYVQQNAFLFSGTLKSNVFFAKEADESIIDQAQGGDIMSEKHGFESQIMQKGANLSGGQKQRLSIARGLAVQPKILLLDDATSALDVKTEVAFKRALNKHYRETTVVLISQKISAIKDADQIIVMDDGKVMATGSHDELLDTSLIYKDIYDSQVGAVVS